MVPAKQRRLRNTLPFASRQPPESRGSRRHSMVFFHQPNHDALIECLPTCLAPGERPKYPPVTSGEHLVRKLSAMRVKAKADEPFLK